MDCTGSTGTAGQVLTSTGGNALQWASASATKQYMSAYGGATLTIPTTALAQKISNWTTYSASGISQVGGDFALTANKTYLFNATIVPSTTPNGVQWGVYCTGVFTLVSPITANALVMCSTVSSASEGSMSFIYRPSVNHCVSVCMGPGGNVTYFAGDNTLTILEI